MSDAGNALPITPYVTVNIDLTQIRAEMHAQPINWLSMDEQDTEGRDGRKS